ncbi:MAG: methyltransferase [Gemmatimonadetes bacterium]|nr:methyltransferase [Gemmatimonadota bacterium]
MPIENVSDTARWVAVYRAMETARPDALFRDPFAERLAGERGQQIVDGMKRGRQMAWPMIVRTAVLDEMILDRVRNGGVDTVINLAAGLDARAWRLDLPPSLQWFDVDLPAISEYKRSIMRGETTKCRYESVAVDLTDDATRAETLRRLGGVAQTALVVTEGLLIYLTAEQVASLARALHATPSIRWWISDIASPPLLKMMKKMWGKSVGNAPFIFAPEDSAAFFAPLGWHEIEFRSGIEEAHRVGREMRLMWL